MLLVVCTPWRGKWMAQHILPQFSQISHSQFNNANNGHKPFEKSSERLSLFWS